MSAASILPHQLAAATLFFYAFVMVIVSRKEHSTKKPPQAVKLTHLDVDLTYCTVDELEYVLFCILVSAQNITLNDMELNRFWDVFAEMSRREMELTR